ncbi:hypothetical protein FRC01_006656 [Tulasnella sp. 417]|nr:hypothetical protein FRC01_006656 [Tulasnella sp. 417]
MHDFFLPRDTVLSDTRVIIAESGRESGGGLEITRSSHPHEGFPAPIDLLPLELLLEVFRLYVDVNTPVRSLVTLILVCKPWRNIVEGTPNLWCHISGREGLNYIRKAVAMAEDTPLEITYMSRPIPKTKPAAFFAEINDRIGQVKSISAYVLHARHFPEILKTAPTPALETLHFLAEWPDRENTNDVTLFGGERASPALKHFYVHHIPVALGSLHLSGLRSLRLSDIRITSAEELLRIFIESPELQACSLKWLSFRTEFTPSEHLRIQLRSWSNTTDAESRPIRLLHLRHLAFLGYPVSFLHFFLSNLQVSTLQSFDIECEPRESPASRLLTTDAHHLAPALRCCTATADKIEINAIGDMRWRIRVGMVNIQFFRRLAEPRAVEETLSLVFGHQNEHFKTLPTSFAIQEFDQYEELICWLSLNLRVTNLANWTGFCSNQRSEHWNIISLLSCPVASMSNQWALPDLEFLDLDVLDEAAKSEILEMVEARHTFIRAQEGHGRDLGLKQFKEIRLHRKSYNVSGGQADDAEFLSALEKVGRGAEIWWEGVKWAGSRPREELVM